MQWDDQKYEFLKSCLISSEMCQPEVSSHEYLKAFPIKSSAFLLYLGESHFEKLLS